MVHSIVGTPNTIFQNHKSFKPAPQVHIEGDDSINGEIQLKICQNSKQVIGGLHSGIAK